MQPRTISDEDEESIRLELMDESPDYDLAIERIYGLTRNDVARFLKKKHPFLTVDDLGTAASEAYIELDEKIREQKIDLNQPIPRLLCTIANRRAIDIVRKRNKKREPKLDFMETVFMDTFTARDWAKKQKSGDSEIILEKIRVFISSAPPLMKAVGEALLHLAPPSPKPEDLKTAVDEILGKPSTLSSVASTLSRLRVELRNLLKN
jgi:DNA-directed RNA polymerase specialized sigma24 family protein